MFLALAKPELNASSTEPLYRQVGAWLRQGILSGAVRGGERLPATRELAQYLGLNRATISSAYALLEQEQLLWGHVGKGSFVRDRHADPHPSSQAGQFSAPASSVQSNGRANADGLISFATSRPSAELFPLEAFRESCMEVLASPEAPRILQLGSPQGYPPLRDYLLAEARAAGLANADDDILITSGCQQALDLVQRLLATAPAATARPVPVAIEDPVYAGIRNAFTQEGLEAHPVPVGAQGLDLARLEEVLALRRPAAVVVTPSFQNPTGSSLPLAARRRLLSLTAQSGAMVLESDLYADLRYTGQPLAPLKQLDERGQVILLRSFSKVAFPGLRVGWVIAPRPLIARLVEIRQWCDLHTDQLSQAVLLRFASSGRLERHREQIRASGAERLAAVLAACAAHLPPGATYTRPEGGMNLWVRLPAALDSAALLAEAQRRGVSYLPGAVFAVGAPDRQALRLSFAGLPPGEIEEGLRILSRLWADELAAGPRAPLLQGEMALV